MRTSTRKNLLVATGYAVAMIAGMIVGPKFSSEDRNRQNGTFLPFLNGRVDKLSSILKLVDERYVDELAGDSLKELAIADIVSHLDPHTTYLPATDAKLLNEDLEGNFYGIGIEYFVLKDTITVTSVVADGPAFRAGILKGDQILRIDQKNVSNTNVQAREVVAAIRGKRGTKVDLLIKRGSERLKKRILRDKITVSSIAAAYLINKETGYVKIERFGSKTSEDFALALKKLQQQGMKNLILDLRGNGGGYLNAATSLADQFLPDKKLIVYTKGANEPRTAYYATEEGDFEQGKLSVLIDENSASASEIVAGAIQDLDRGTILGRRSFGKGLVQEQFDFGDGSALNLTIARYYTPSGRSIQKSYLGGNDRYYNEVHQRFTKGEMLDEKLSKASLDQKHPFKTSHGKTVYGGGGIMPDVYIPLDTTAYTPLYRSLFSSGTINEFVYSTLAPKMKPLPLTNFVAEYAVQPDEFAELLAIARRKGITVDKGQVGLSKREIEQGVKALLAEYYYGDEGYFRVINSQDSVVRKALALLK